MRIANARVVTPDAVLPDAGVTTANGRIVEVDERRRAGDVDLEGCYLLPGLVDIHVHQDPDDYADPARFAALCADLRRLGTAAFLATTTSVPVGELATTLRRIRDILDTLGPDCGCAGIYLEAPYVDPATRGGFAPQALAGPQTLPLESVLDACGPWARYVNISPELPGAIEAIAECRRRGLAVSMGHSTATRARLDAAVDAGAGSVTHIFNTGTIMRYKEPGVLDMTLDLLGLASERLTAQVICDGVHVDPLLVRLLYRAKGADGVALITDSIAGGRAAPEGLRISSGTSVYTVRGGVGRLPDGTLAGSTLHMARALKNYAAFTGCALPEAARAAASTPARVVGIDADYGAIAPGRKAVFCVLDDALEVRADLCARVNGVAV